MVLALLYLKHILHSGAGFLMRDLLKFEIKMLLHTNPDLVGRGLLLLGLEG